jgi:hypothetical protein
MSKVLFLLLVAITLINTQIYNIQVTEKNPSLTTQSTQHSSQQTQIVVDSVKPLSSQEGNRQISGARIVRSLSLGTKKSKLNSQQQNSKSLKKWISGMVCKE